MPATKKKRLKSNASSFADYLRMLFSRQGGRQAIFLRYTFYIYIGWVFLFGGLYYALFRRNPAAFMFTADILSAQATTFKLAARRDSVTAELQIRYLQTLVDSLEARPKAMPLTSRLGSTGSQAVIKFGSREYSISRSVHDSGVGAPESPGLIEVRQDAAVLTSLELPSGKLDVTPSTTSELQEQARQMVDYLQEQLTRSHELVMRLPATARPSWDYADFVYFSAITQLTVGYGDILPNTTMVRLLVVVQSLLAVMMLVVVINLVVTGNPVSRESTPE
jgi:hypothetical protein